MINIVQEAYTPKKMTATGQVFTGPAALIGFLCTTAGTLQVDDAVGGATNNVIPVFDVAEGQWYPMPFTFSAGAYATLTSAQGVFGVAQ